MKNSKKFFLYARCWVVLTVFSLSILIAACGAAENKTTQSASPTPTMTLNLDKKGSPIPQLPAYWCGAWTPNPTPSVNSNRVAVYGKFTKNNDGNPLGVGGATATATIQWDGAVADTVTATTSNDGLAVFVIDITNRRTYLNRQTLITVNFSKPGESECKVENDRAAFFTLITGPGVAGSNNPPSNNPPANTTPAPMPTMPSNNPNDPNNQPTQTPSVEPTKEPPQIDITPPTFPTPDDKNPGNPND